MLAVSGNELSPIVTGIDYCGVILACQAAHAVRRAPHGIIARRSRALRAAMAGGTGSPSSVA